MRCAARGPSWNGPLRRTRRYTFLYLIVASGLVGCDTSSPATPAGAETPANVNDTLADQTNPSVQAELTPSPTASSEPLAGESASSTEDDQNVSTQVERRSEQTTPAQDMRVRPRLSIRKGGVRDLTFDDLEFKIEKDANFERSMLSEEIEELADKKVIIRGFILASSVFQQRGIKQFVLVRDNQECCFGPGAYIYHNIQIEMVDGATANFSIRPVSVEGTISIKPWIGPDEKCYSVYHMLASKVQ